MSELHTNVVRPLLQIQDISAGSGPVAERWRHHLDQWSGEFPPIRRTEIVEKNFSQDARDLRRFQLKTHFATVAMHLNEEWRRSLFKQLDLLLDPGEDWEEDQALPVLESWKTFVRLVIHYPFRKTPRLGLFEGSISGVWMYEDIRITLECLAGDQVRWVASKDAPEGRDAAAGETTIKRLISYITPFGAEDWLLDGKNKT